MLLSGAVRLPLHSCKLQHSSLCKRRQAAAVLASGLGSTSVQLQMVRGTCSTHTVRAAGPHWYHQQSAA
jgi:hypothetical protein